MTTLEEKIEGIKQSVKEAHLESLRIHNTVEVAKHEIDILLESEKFLEAFVLIVFSSHLNEHSFKTSGVIKNINFNLTTSYYNNLPIEVSNILDLLKKGSNVTNYIYKTGTTRNLYNNLAFESILLGDNYLMNVVNPYFIKHGFCLKHNYVTGDKRETTDIKYTYDLVLI